MRRAGLTLVGALGALVLTHAQSGAPAARGSCEVAALQRGAPAGTTITTAAQVDAFLTVFSTALDEFAPMMRAT